ncbi:hypothetical protein LTR65_000370 [Meristemomyces frigidus]
MAPPIQPSPSMEMRSPPRSTSPTVPLRCPMVANPPIPEQRRDSGPTATQTIEESSEQPLQSKTQTLLPIGMDFNFTLRTQATSATPQTTRFCKGLTLASKPNFATL